MTTRAPVKPPHARPSRSRHSGPHGSATSRHHTASKHAHPSRLTLRSSATPIAPKTARLANADTLPTGLVPRAHDSLPSRTEKGVPPPKGHKPSSTSTARRGSLAVIHPTISTSAESSSPPQRIDVPPDSRNRPNPSARIVAKRARRGFCFVAVAEPRHGLPLWLVADREEKSESAGPDPLRCLGLRKPGVSGQCRGGRSCARIPA